MPQSLSQIRALLAGRGVRPRKRLGQHFLHDGNQITRLVAAAGVERGALVLEVGPGTGALTDALLAAGAEVVACEIDPVLASIVEERLGDRVRLVRGDCLGRGRTLSPPLVETLGGRPFTLVANLPYQVASTLVGALLIRHPECRGQFVTIQKEVADRLLADPGTKDYGALTVIVRALADVTLIGTVAPSCFWPAPAVSSAMVAIRPRPAHGIDDPAAFAGLATRLFSKRRKQLGTILGRDHPRPPGVTPDRRPETLTVEQLVDTWRLTRQAGGE